MQVKNCRQCGELFTPKRKEQVYCSKSCASVLKGAARKGKKTGPWKDHTYSTQIDRHGYVRCYARLHPYSNGRLMMLQHRMIMENHLGRALSPDEHVHHRNGDRATTRLENLEVHSRSQHFSMHGQPTTEHPERTHPPR